MAPLAPAEAVMVYCPMVKSESLLSFPTFPFTSWALTRTRAWVLTVLGTVQA